jgi:hypothetical protein
MIHGNNFVDNSVQVQIFVGSINTWDGGYATGGNYWRDYLGIDEKSGPNQDQPESDNLGDTPYIIDRYNQDNYPLMRPVNPLFCDMNYDFKVDMRDIGVAAWAIGSYPTHPRWNIQVDLNQDDEVNMKDLVIIARNFGKTHLD